MAQLITYDRDDNEIACAVCHIEVSIEGIEEGINFVDCPDSECGNENRVNKMEDAIRVTRR